ncbi:MAG: hypothetical protein E8D46_04865 [Nitrospira sp.]|nr:MAG: hypothetical protein E8D46_04865 [Nitrospira sp.]
MNSASPVYLVDGSSGLSGLFCSELKENQINQTNLFIKLSSDPTGSHRYLSIGARQASGTGYSGLFGSVGSSG